LISASSRIPPTEKAEKLLPQRPGDGLPDGGLPDPGWADETDDRSLHVAFELAHREKLEDSFLHILETVVVSIEDAGCPLQVKVPRLRRGPGELDDRVEVVAGDGELRRVGLHQLKLLEFLFDLAPRLALDGQRVEGLTKTLILGTLGVGGHAELLLDRLEFLLEEVFPLALLDLLVDLHLDALLNAHQFLLLLDEEQYFFESRVDIEGCQYVLLGVPLDVEDARHKVRDLPRLVDVDHVETHFLREERVVLAHLLRFGDN
jgi:hypothetical protein